MNTSFSLASLSNTRSVDLTDGGKFEAKNERSYSSYWLSHDRALTEVHSFIHHKGYWGPHMCKNKHEIAFILSLRFSRAGGHG